VWYDICDDSMTSVANNTRIPKFYPGYFFFPKEFTAEQVDPTVIL
jgi:hypothetical protein